MVHVIISFPANHITASTGINERRRVLVVEDDRDTGDTFRLLLESLDQDVRWVVDGHSALVEGREFLPQMMFIDIGLPDINGFELASLLKAEIHPAPILIALSGFGEEKSRAQAMAAGYDDYLVKPLSMDRLKALLAQAF